MSDNKKQLKDMTNKEILDITKENIVEFEKIWDSTPIEDRNNRIVEWMHDDINGKTMIKCVTLQWANRFNKELFTQIFDEIEKTDIIEESKKESKKNAQDT